MRCWTYNVLVSCDQIQRYFHISISCCFSFQHLRDGPRSPALTPGGRAVALWAELATVEEELFFLCPSQRKMLMF